MATVYKGMAFPFDGTIPGTFDAKTIGDLLTSSVLSILLTSKGERVMRPEFGSDVPQYLFDPQDEDQREGLKAEIEDSLRQWDDRIQVENLDIRFDTETGRTTCILSIQNAKDPLRHTQQLEFDFLDQPSGI